MEVKRNVNEAPRGWNSVAAARASIHSLDRSWGLVSAAHRADVTESPPRIQVHVPDGAGNPKRWGAGAWREGLIQLGQRRGWESKTSQTCPPQKAKIESL